MEAFKEREAHIETRGGQERREKFQDSKFAGPLYMKYEGISCVHKGLMVKDIK